MADNVKIPYVAKENKQVGTHSFYPQPIAKGTFGFDRMCKKAAKNTTIEEHTVRAAVQEYMKVAQEALLEGNRVEIGEQFITLYPNLKGSVKDYKDKDGNVVVVTAKDLTAQKCKSRVGATVNRYFSDEFERNVSWVKTDKTGAVIDEGEDATETNEELNENENQNQNTNPGTGDNNSGGFDEG
jgi:nucleoid DNA-binding protein